MKKYQQISRDVLRHTFAKKNISLVNRRLILPTGIKTQIDLVLHPGAVLVVPFLSADRVVILRQFRPAIKQYLYEFPAGTLEPGERGIVCARRELKEEAGYNARTITRIGEIYPVPGYSNEEIVIYQARGLTPQKESGDFDEVIEPVIMSTAQLRKLFYNRRIRDAKTIAGLAFARII